MRKALGATLALAVGLRLVWLAEWMRSPLVLNPTPDGQMYLRWGAGIAAGDWLGTYTTYMHPGYAYLLGGLFTLAGPSVGLAVCLQILTGVGAAVIAAWAAGAAFGVVAAWMTGMLAAAYLPAMFFEGLIGSAAWLHLFHLASLAAMLQAARRGWPARWCLLAGIAMGGSTSMRASGALGLAVLLLWAARRAPRPVRGTAIGWCLAGWALVVLPFVIRLQVLEKRWGLDVASASLMFHRSNLPGGAGYEPLRGEPMNPVGQVEFARREAERELGKPVTAVEVAAVRRREAAAAIVGDPSGFVRRIAGRFVRVWHRREHGMNADPDFFARRLALLRWPLPGFGVLGVLALVGMGVAVTRATPGGRLAAGFLVAMLIPPLLFNVTADYRYPMIAPALILAGGAGAWLLAEARNGRWARAGLAAGLAVAWMVFCNARDIGINPAGSHLNLGHAYLAAGRLEEARKEYESAVAAAPGWEPAVRALAVSRFPSPPEGERVGARGR